ncbi:ABC transporter permease [Actinorhabdospora filicis]|uniref:ABC transporter permease n=1 Tax=Actinorhabdospora filicis TaxID=1785913 RepID=A0A9W6SP09_9ACTN|nr:ECF transporter S component [Actinorhabdospora filicis]GLZ79389.1 ABC transporter permease [Actinorhabdospora filicis]
MSNVGGSPARWRTVDIVTAAVLAVAFGVVFWAWGLLWKASDPLFTFFAPAQALLYGVWLIPAVLASLIIRKAGAGILTEAIAATISALLGSQWGLTVVWQGLIEGAGGELGFALGRYRRFGTGTAILSGALAGLAATIFDCIQWYSTFELWSYRVPYVACGVVSSALIAGLGSVLLTKALAGTGVLDAFPSGRGRAAI